MLLEFLLFQYCHTYCWLAADASQPLSTTCISQPEKQSCLCDWLSSAPSLRKCYIQTTNLHGVIHVCFTRVPPNSIVHRLMCHNGAANNLWPPLALCQWEMIIPPSVLRNVFSKKNKKKNKQFQLKGLRSAGGDGSHQHPIFHLRMWFHFYGHVLLPDSTESLSKQLIPLRIKSIFSRCALLAFSLISSCITVCSVWLCTYFFYDVSVFFRLCKLSLFVRSWHKDVFRTFCKQICVLSGMPSLDRGGLWPLGAVALWPPAFI